MGKKHTVVCKNCTVFNSFRWNATVFTLMLKWNWLLPSLSEKCSLLESQKKTMRSEKTWKQIHRSPYWFIREMRKSGLPGEKSLEQLENQLQKQATYDTGPHWWEVSSLSTAPSLLPNKRDCRNEIAVRRGSSRWHYSVFAIFWTRLIVLTLTVSDPQMQLFAYPMSCIRAICLLFMSSF